MQNNRNQVRVAITGGIGSGKSVFSSFLKKRGYSVINADNLAKELMTTNRFLRRAIMDNFGSESYIEESINIEYLANTVFSNPEKVRLLNSIVHPVVIREIVRLMDNDDNEFVFTEAALIFEAKMERFFDFIVLITSDLEIRVKRVMDRDNASRDSIIKRMENQFSETEKLKRSDFVFENNSTEEDLELKADLLLKLIKH